MQGDQEPGSQGEATGVRASNIPELKRTKTYLRRQRRKGRTGGATDQPEVGSTQREESQPVEDPTDSRNERNEIPDQLAVEGDVLSSASTDAASGPESTSS